MDQADAFEAALFERDVAELQHPVYGIIKVIPTGNIKREDNLVSALNESHVTVSFTETITDESPTEIEAVTAAEIDEKYEEFSEAAAADFAEGLSVDTVAEAIQLESALETELQFVDENLSGLVSVDAGTLANFKTTSGEFKSVIQELKNDRFAKIKNLYNDAKKVFRETEKFVNKALNAARLSLHLMKLPSRIAVNIMEKLNNHRLKAVGFLAAESRLETKAS
jgi:prophage DNA circulation protein